MKRSRSLLLLLLSGGVTLGLAGCGQTPLAAASSAVQAQTTNPGTVSSELKLNFSGVRLVSAAADIKGNLIVGGTRPLEQYTLGLVRKLDPGGRELWSRTFAGSSRSGFVGRLATDRSGNVYFLARLYVGDGYDTLTKLSEDGTFLWSQSGSFEDLAVDAGGNAYTIARNDKPQVIKWSAGGARLWARDITTSCQSARIGVSLSGLAYTNCQTSDGGPVVLTQYQTDGTRGFQKSFDGTFLAGVGVSPAGSAFSLRHTDYRLNRPGDALTKYNAGGVWQWAQLRLSEETPRPPVGGYWHPNALALSDAAKVYVGGGSQNGDSIWEGVAYLQKRDPDSGDPIWRAVITCPTATLCETNAVAVGALGKVWAVGTYGSQADEQGSFVARFAQ